MTGPVISIVCNTYNHEKYIAQALESFLMQKVNVPIEILVHDDASTDRTADIIREYEAKYPEIIKPILQTENQFSKGRIITWNIQVPRAKGKYIAFCEGDDYWTDPDKLQKQYDFLSAHEEYSACCHGYITVDKDRNLIEHKSCYAKEQDIALVDFLGNQLNVPQLATFMYRKDAVCELNGIFLGEMCNDLIIRIYLATNGKIRYLEKEMSAYRRFAEGSWTERVGKNKEKFAKSLRQYESFFKQLDVYTDGKYHSEIEAAIDQRLFQVDLLENNYKSAIRRSAYKAASVKQKIYVVVGCVFPKLVSSLRK